MAGARRPLARNARRAGENSRKRRVSALPDGHRKTPMQAGRRFDRRGMRTRAFTKPENSRRRDQAVRGRSSHPVTAAKSKPKRARYHGALERGDPDPEAKHADTPPTSAGCDIDDNRATERNTANRLRRAASTGLRGRRGDQPRESELPRPNSGRRRRIKARSRQPMSVAVSRHRSEPLQSRLGDGRPTRLG